MKIVQITPGAGAMYCGNCFRDNALVAALRQAGHQALMIPLYLPLTLEEEDQSAGTPIFFSGLNVYLEQKLAFFRHTPDWLHRWLASRSLLRWVAGRSARTRPRELGELTVSMLRGESGYQAREVEDLITWLAEHERPDVICLSNALLIGLVRSLQQRLDVPVACMLQGEDSFLDALPESFRSQAWAELGARAREADLLVAPSRYFADLMVRRLALPPERVRVVHNGISLAGYDKPPAEPEHGSDSNRPDPVWGYFARMCREKGLDILVEAFIEIKRRGRVKNLRLRVGGGCGPADQPFVQTLRDRLRAEGLLDQVEFHPNLDRAAKLRFLQSLTVFSVPAVYGEAFGLYLLEALAAGVPVVQPRHAAFPELIEATGGGLLCLPNHPQSLAETAETLLLDPALARKLGETGRDRVAQDFSVQRMMEGLVGAYCNLLDGRSTKQESPRADV
jgi:glycosyltransferase involved in cell wall biosynthesis